MRLAWILLLAAPLLTGADQTPGRGPLQLSLKRAVEIATSPEGSAKIQLSGESLKQIGRASCRERV